MNKRLPGRIYWTVFFIYCAFIFYLSSKSHPLPAAVGKYFSDWILHGVEYAFLGFFLTGALRFSLRIKSLKVLLLGAVVIGALYGGTDEIHQLFVPQRQCELKDWMADAIGSFGGSVFFWWVVMASAKRKTVPHA